jgi:hypothetical protein
MTVSAWVKMTDDDTTQPIIVKADSLNAGFTFTIASGGNSLFMRLANSGTVSDIVKFYRDFENWHHVTGVFDGTNEILYIDGFEALREPASVSSLGSTTGILSIGTSTSGGFGGTYFNGIIDEVRLFNRALSHYEILDVMYHGLPPS